MTKTLKPAATRPQISTVEDGFKALRELKERSEAAATAVSAHLEACRNAERELQKAVKAEDFEAAARHKKARDDADAARTKALATQRELAAQFTAVQERASELYFAERGRQPEDVKVNRITVVDPATGDQASETYIEPDANICFRVADRSFDSEAWHVSEWASKHGFLVRHETAIARF